MPLSLVTRVQGTRETPEARAGPAEPLRRGDPASAAEAGLPGAERSVSGDLFQKFL